jgi:hypothetical protein
MNFKNVGSYDLQLLKKMMETGRLKEPFSEVQLSRWFSGEALVVLSSTLDELNSRFFGVDQILTLLEALLAERASEEVKEMSAVELVISGPELDGFYIRDTSVVVNDLFLNAQESVLVAGYTIHDGKRVFQCLSERMAVKEDVAVRLFLNIERGYRDTTQSEMLVTEFSRRFRNEHWPSNCRLPEVYYYKDSLHESWKERASLHAKCVVADGEQYMITSANFTDAAQRKNIEIGVKQRNPIVAAELIGYFDQLIQAGRLGKLSIG